MPRIYKVALPWQRRRMKKILSRRMDQEDAEAVVDNMRGNEGVYIPETQNLNLDIDPEDPVTFQDGTIAAEERRKITEAMFKELDDAGLVERNVKKIIDKYMLESARRIEAKKLKDFIEPSLRLLQESSVPSEFVGPTLRGRDVAATPDELKLIKNVYNAINLSLIHI